MDELLDVAPCGFLSVADDGAIVLVNRTLLDLLGYAREELVGRSVESVLTIATRIFWQTHFFPLLALHGRAEEVFLVLRLKEGGDVGALVNAVRRRRGGVPVTDCVLLPVRERRKFEDALLRAKREAEEANRAKSAFLAMMSHELRTPLNAIGGYVQLLELGARGPVSESQREALGRILRAQRHLLRLINDVLNLSRIEAGRVEYAVEDLPLADVVRAVEPMVAPQAQAKGLALDVRVPDGLVARGDRDKVQQIVINLLGNAVKFTPPGGRIAVVGDECAGPDDVCLTVEDTGPGIPPAKLEAIFQPFVQVDTSLTRPEGTGLGLAISRDLARGMGGDLAVRSRVGEGSAFTLRLPRAARAS